MHQSPPYLEGGRWFIRDAWLNPIPFWLRDVWNTVKMTSDRRVNFSKNSCITPHPPLPLFSSPSIYTSSNCTHVFLRITHNLVNFLDKSKGLLDIRLSQTVPSNDLIVIVNESCATNVSLVIFNKESWGLVPHFWSGQGECAGWVWL